MSEPPPDNPPPPEVLDYATLDADGLPPFVAEAEALIDAKEKPGKLRRYFVSSALALKYFVKSMQRRHAFASLKGRCECCGASPCPTYVSADWWATIALKSHEWLKFRSPPAARFRTSYVLCEACHIEWVRLKRRQRTVEWSVVSAFVILALLYIATRTWGGYRVVDIPDNIVVPMFLIGSILPQLIVNYGPAAYPVALGMPRRLRCRSVSPLMIRPTELDDAPPAAIVEQP